ncbi:MAG: hypothetical protein AAF902_23930 [Chloroflexota bacterium]
MNKKIDQDPFSNPNLLKNDDTLIETLKKSDGVRWPGAFFLMGLTLFVGLTAGLSFIWLLFFANDKRTELMIEFPIVEHSDEMPPNPIPLGGTELETAEGKFTEWYLTTEKYSNYPIFSDAVYHPATGRIYLVADNHYLY